MAKLNIKIFGLGGAGIRVLNDLTALYDLDEVELICVDTDAQSLANTKIQDRILIGDEFCQGNGTGGDFKLAKKAIFSDEDILKEAMENTNLCILISGLGNGTGSMLSPFMAKLAAEAMVDMCISFNILPQKTEGSDKLKLTNSLLKFLKKKCHACVELPNDILIDKTANLSIKDSFKQANDTICSSVYSICKSLSNKSIINLDIAALKKVFAKKGNNTFFANATSDNTDNLDELLAKLWLCPLSKNFKTQPDNLLLNIICPENFGMNKMQYILENISQKYQNIKNLKFAVSAHQRELLHISLMGVDTSQDAQTKEPTTIKRKDLTSHKQKKRNTSIAGNTKEITPQNLVQEEFSFMDISQQRGFFNETVLNIRNDEDIDVPTYLRKKINFLS